MVKILAGLIAAALIAVGGYFGFEFYVQHRVAAEVEEAFAAVRAGGGKASHGKVSFDMWSRTVTVADIAGESAAQPPVVVKIGRFTAAGVKQPDAGRFSADRIEATDVDVAGALAGPTRLQFAYKAPRIDVAGYSGSAGPLRRADPSAPSDIYRFALEHFAAVTATSVTAPALSGSMTSQGAPAIGIGEYAYSGLAMRDIREGRIAAMTVDRATFTTPVDLGGKEKMTGEVLDIAAFDFDTAATLTLFDPARAKDDKYYRAYRQMKTGAYTVSFDSGMKFRMDGMSANDIGLRPSKLQFSQIMAVVESAPRPGTVPTPAQTRDMLEKVAGIYEGLSFADVEVHGLSMDTGKPQGPVTLGAIRLGKLENGKLAEFAIEGFDASSPTGPVKIGRFALKSLDVANLMRLSAQFSTLGRQDPSPEQLLAMLSLLAGIELKDASAPYPGAARPGRIDALNLDWGQFVGPIPTKARITAKIYMPARAGDDDLERALAAAGVTNLNMTFDLGAAWTESTRTFALEPVAFEIGSGFTGEGRLSLANVQRETFSLNSLQAVLMAAQIEAGPVEMSLRDQGGVSVLVLLQARAQKISPEAARQTIIDTIRTNAMQMASVNPDVMLIAGALTRFMEKSGGTLTIRLTPKGKVAMMELLDAAKTTPLAALSRFEVEAKTEKQ